VSLKDDSSIRGSLTSLNRHQAVHQQNSSIHLPFEGGNSMPLAFGLASSNVLVYGWIVQGPGTTTFSLSGLWVSDRSLLCLADLPERMDRTLDDPRSSSLEMLGRVDLKVKRPTTRILSVFVERGSARVMTKTTPSSLGCSSMMDQSPPPSRKASRTQCGCRGCCEQEAEE
jgi:hypothetical protein